MGVLKSFYQEASRYVLFDEDGVEFHANKPVLPSVDKSTIKTDFDVAHIVVLMSEAILIRRDGEELLIPLHVWQSMIGISSQSPPPKVPSKAG